MTRDPNCIEAAALRALLAGETDVLVLDVRSPAEYGCGHIRGSTNLPLDALPDALSNLPPAAEIVTVCGKGGGRSEQAVALLRNRGLARVRSLCGGMAAWAESEGHGEAAV